jgi:hypothetical protein
MAWGPWVNLAYDDEEQVDNAVPAVSDKPSYPWGLRICLCARELEMLGLSLPAKGDLLDLRAMAEVTSVSDGEMGQRVELTITMMRLEDEDDDDD